MAFTTKCDTMRNGIILFRSNVDIVYLFNKNNDPKLHEQNNNYWHFVVMTI